MKKPKGSERSRAMALADKYYSQYVRLESAHKENFFTEDGLHCKCITCGDLFYWKRIDCGHFMSRDCQSTRYDQMNTAPQCYSCNRFGGSKQYEFGRALDKIYGEGSADKIVMKSKMLCPRKTHDFKYIANEYRLKVNELKKEM